MKDYQRDFIAFCIENQVLKFGQFTLKSGRVSPYFFNAGLFCSGRALTRLGHFYAAAIHDHLASSTTPTTTTTTTTAAAAARPHYDVLFGPAYKGIPLVTCTAISLFSDFQLDFPIAFNRKETKHHGEGGQLVGASLHGDILLIDDVITAGTAIRESVDLISKQPNARLAAVVISLDRQERGPGDANHLSAIQQVEKDLAVNVISIVTLANVLDYLTSHPDSEKYQQHIDAIQAYRQQYGV